MKIILLSFIFIPIIAGQVAWGQTYHPFPDSNAVWNVLEYTHYPDSTRYNTIHYALFGDTLINSLNYHKIFRNNGLTDSTIELSSPNTIYYGALREEVSTKIIYYLPKDSSQEGLLYKFDINIMDTIVIQSIWGDNIVRCDAIDSILINNQYRKKFIMWHPFSSTWETWIEGIGSTKELLYNYHDLFYPYTELLCFFNNDILIYHLNSTTYPGGFPSYDSIFYSGCFHECIIITNLNVLSINEIISVCPNPIVDKSILKIPDSFSIKNATVGIYNIQGILVRKIKITEGRELYLDKSEFSAGLYFFKIINEHTIYSGKFLVQ